MERLVKGIWIPVEIWQDERLSWNEKILLMEVDSFTKAGKDCYFSNEYIAQMFGFTERSARNLLHGLIEKGYISVVRTDGRRRYICSNLRLVIKAEKNFQADRKKTSTQSGNELPCRPEKDFLHTDIKDINKSTEDNNPPISPAKDKFDFWGALRELGVTDEVAEEWKHIRKVKKAVDSKIAFDRIASEIRKSGKPADDCIRIAVEKSWKGFEAEWLEKPTPLPPARNQQQPPRPKLTNIQKLMLDYDLHNNTHTFLAQYGWEPAELAGIDEQ